MPTLPSIRTSIENSQSLVIDSFARKGLFRRDKRGRLVAYTGGFSVVYPLSIIMRCGLFVVGMRIWAI